MPFHVTTMYFVLLASTLLLALFFSFLYRLKHQDYLLAWSIAWGLFCIHFFTGVLMKLSGSEVWLKLDGIVNETVLVMASFAFYCAARLYAGLRISVRAVGAVVGIGLVWSIAHANHWVEVPVVLAMGILFLLVGYTFWEEGRKQEARVDLLLAITFAAWGLLALSGIFRVRMGLLPGVDLFPLMALPELFTCVLMVMAVYEEERRRVERNMLALSNLNLAASGFAGGEIHKMLGQALDRVLNVVRIPAGILCVQQTEPRASNSVIVTGLSETLAQTIHESKLDEYMVNLVARLGGLVVLRDLVRDSNWEALEQEESFRQARQLLLGQGLRTLVGISLQAKGRVFGVLLLATPDNRGFTPAELRLLMALGQQIGMSVENSYLMHQTARRTEELHILNEIGRALSSTLELDALLSESTRKCGACSTSPASSSPPTIRRRAKSASKLKSPTASAARNARVPRVTISWNMLFAPLARC